MLSQFSSSSSASVRSNRVLYTAGEFAKQNLIYLQEAGTLTAVKGHKSVREKLNSFLLFCVISGSGKLSYMGKEYFLKEGDCVFIDCKQGYAHETFDGSLWQLVWFHFYGAPAKAIYEEYIKNGGKPVFQTMSAESLLQTERRIAEESGKEASYRDTVLFSVLSDLIAKAVSEGLSKTNYHGGKISFSVREYLDTNFESKISLEELSEHFHINKYYLTRVFKASFGQSITEYLIEKRINTAKQLLRFTDDTAENIALSCGISDAGYFGRLFKRLEGVTPGEYRARWNTIKNDV